MVEIDILEQETMLDDSVAEQAQAREAAEDLERIEEEVKREAEQYVEAVDGDGDEKKSVEAAGTAFDFDEAELDTAMLEGEVEEGLES